MLHLKGEIIMKSEHKEIEKQMVSFTFGIYVLSAFISGWSLIITEGKGRVGYYIGSVLFVLGYFLVKYLNKKQIAKYFKELEMREYYAIQRQREEER